jgi:hypothetical protein
VVGVVIVVLVVEAAKREWTVKKKRKERKQNKKNEKEDALFMNAPILDGLAFFFLRLAKALPLCINRKKSDKKKKKRTPLDTLELLFGGIIRMW